MNYAVDEKIKEAATKCENGHACLECEEHELCAVQHFVMHELLFVECLHTASCPYKEKVSKITICTCPVRKEIYRRYRK
jgi:hypothetical protein